MIIDGIKIAEGILKRVQREVKALKRPPVLAVVLVGHDPASALYVRIKEKRAKEIGIDFKKFVLSENSAEKDVLKLIHKLNRDENINAIVLQLPLPNRLDPNKIISLIAPQKDADSLTKFSELRSPTVEAIMEIFKYYKISLMGKNIVIVGHGKLVGNPLSRNFKDNNISHIVLDSETKDLKKYTKMADILISATGVPRLIGKDMIKKNAVVIDAGTSVEKIRNSKLETRNKLEIEDKQNQNLSRISRLGFRDSRVQGDVNFENVKKIASYITPPVGGVGPITVAKLLENVIFLTKNQKTEKQRN